MSWTDGLSPEETERPRQSPKRVKRDGTRERRYALAALEGEANTVRSAGKGTRNATLNKAAFNLGGYIAAELLTDAEVFDALFDAARDAGLGESEIKATIASGFSAGKKEPREVPEARVANDTSAIPEPPPGRFDDKPARAPAPAPAVIEILDSSAIFAPLEEPDYIIENVIRRGSVNELVAYGQSGKTWLAFDALLAVGGGRDWLGRFPTKQGKALFLDYEAGEYECRRRIQAIASATGCAVVPGIGLATMPAVYMTSPTYERTMLALCKDLDLVIIDSLTAARPGIDENDSNMRVGLDTLRRVGEKTGTAFLVLVHAKKVSGSVTTIDPREAGRGSSAIFDAADAAYHVHYRENAPLTVSQTKARLGRQIDPFQVEIMDTDSGGVSVMASDVPRAETTASDAFEARCSKVLELVRADPGCSGAEVRELAGMRPATVGAALKYLERNGAIVNKGTAKGAAWYPTAPRQADQWRDFATE